MECQSCRRRKMLQNEYLVAKVGVDTAENEPSKSFSDMGDAKIAVTPVFQLSFAYSSTPCVLSLLFSLSFFGFSQIAG